MIKYTVSDDEFIINNYTKMTTREIAKVIGKLPGQVDNHIHVLKKKGLIYNKSNYNSSVDATKLEVQGIQNKYDMTSIRKRIKLNKFIKLQINNITENCEIIFKTYNYFTIRHNNYVDSFNYTDLLMGVVSFATDIH